MQHVYGALDLGTNNCRLLVARTAPLGFQVVDAFSRVVRLGEGLDRSGGLSEAAMDRAIEALRVCAGKMRRAGVDRARAVATEACRRAYNCTEFLQRVEAETGLAIETITCEEEARLAIHGCLPLLDEGKPNALMFDIGGGSTQIVWLDLTGSRPQMLGSLSIPDGVVTLSERHGQEGFTEAGYAALIDRIGERLAPFCDRFGIAEAVQQDRVQMVGTSGTVTTLTGIDMGLARYDRSRVDGAMLGFPAIREISHRLLTADAEDRAAEPCIGAERADLVVAGCAILESICRRWPVGRLRVADRGVREGILIDLMESSQGGPDRNAGI
ncbi:MAG: Ppx/GppA phosphatase family protein [Alphaproteobacteria bacterium]